MAAPTCSVHQENEHLLCDRPFEVDGQPPGGSVTGPDV